MSSLLLHYYIFIVLKVPCVRLFVIRLFFHPCLVVSSEIYDLFAKKVTLGGVGFGDSLFALGGVVDLPKKFLTLLKNPSLMQAI
jgi:hypothetical protein